VLFEDDRYAFDRRLPYWFDLEAIERHLDEGTEAEASLEARLQAARSAAHLYRGDLLEELDGDWFIARRVALRERLLGSLVEVGDRLAVAGRCEEALPFYRRAVELDPYLESAHRGVMAALAASGERALAVRHFQELRSRLREELGAEPSRETVQLAERLRAAG
jgi:DNA-binding SARP family transcriptional activator